MLTDRQMAAKQYLKQAYRCNELIKSGLEEITNLRAASVAIQTSDLTKEKVKSTHSSEAPFVGAVNKLVDLEKQIDNEAVKLLELKQEIRDVIFQVKNVNGILVLRYRYLDFMKWEDIADRIEYSLKSVYRIHEAALNDVADVLSKRGNAA